MEKLCPSKHITKRDFSGKLLIDGDLHDNCILFRFLFDRQDMVQPLLIWIKVVPLGLLKQSGRRNKGQHTRIFVLECSLPDLSNPIVKTRLLYPEWLLRKNMIRVIGIEPQISCQV